jgi:hypothetical protein
MTLNYDDVQRIHRKIRPTDLGATSVLDRLKAVDNINNLPPEEMKEIILAMQEIAKGGSFDRPKEEAVTQRRLEQLEKMIERQNLAMQRLESYLTNPEKFVQDTLEQNQSKLSPEQKARFRAQKMKEVQDLVVQQKVMLTQARHDMENEPKEAVIWPGRQMKIKQNGQEVFVTEGLPLNINGIAFKYRPGETIKVPKSVAERVRQYYRSREETLARQNALSTAPGKMRSDAELLKEWNRINSAYGSPTPNILRGN